jgi:ABC-2 type transport system ATP-binding protein
MRQRVGLAQALIHSPEVLILDEPTIGLDPVQIIEVRNLIKELGKDHTILLSTHILSEAQQVCNRVMIINRGRIVAEDTPERLQDRLTGSRRVSVQVGGDGDGLASVVAAVPGVARLMEKEDGRLEFETVPGMDPRADVARAVIQAGYDLLEMRPYGVSLEEIFLELTRDEPTPPQPAEEELLDESISDLKDLNLKS